MENKKAMQVIKEEGVKGFMERWKDGIQKVTPLQQTNSQILFTYIIIVGLICGIGASLIAWKKLWWVIIILLGALLNTYISLISLKQKRQVLVKVEEVMKGGIQYV